MTYFQYESSDYVAPVTRLTRTQRGTRLGPTHTYVCTYIYNIYIGLEWGAKWHIIVHPMTLFHSPFVLTVDQIRTHSYRRVDWDNCPIFLFHPSNNFKQIVRNKTRIDKQMRRKFIFLYLSTQKKKNQYFDQFY